MAAAVELFLSKAGKIFGGDVLVIVWHDSIAAAVCAGSGKMIQESEMMCQSSIEYFTSSTCIHRSSHIAHFEKFQQTA
jgi:hypothetical protein